MPGMARRPPAATPTATKDAEVSALPSLDAATPALFTPWDILAFRPLREIAAIADPEERRLAALDRLESIQRMAANRSRTIRDGVVIYDPDGNTILKAEELVQRILAIDPSPPKPMSAETLEPFERAPLALAR